HYLGTPPNPGRALISTCIAGNAPRLFRYEPYRFLPWQRLHKLNSFVSANAPITAVTKLKYSIYMYDIHAITISGGKGGNGSIGFRREKFIPRGGPDGGDGGNGGNVLFIGTDSVNDLVHLVGVPKVEGENAMGGSGRNRSGHDGQTKSIRVPLGTVIWERTDSGMTCLGEIVSEGDVIVAARGGHGGSGNKRFATPTNRTPWLAEAGLPGELKELVLELRMKIDVGMIGMPNAGKSQLLQKISKARPEVAGYPFTTTEPAPGVVTREWKSFVIAELPGILPGANQGNSLGRSFLRHLWRAKVIVHLLDGSVEDPSATITGVNTEVAAFESSFLQKPQVIVVNKIDLPAVRARIPVLRRRLARYGVSMHFISAETGEGVEELVEQILQLLEETPPEPNPLPPPAVVRLLRQSRSAEPQVVRDGLVFVVLSPKAERMVRLADLRRFQARLQLRQMLTRLGIAKALEEAGVQPGDTVRIGVVEMKWE
ncbi:MAG: GTPase ObgE, partial [Dehalococcoidia bacterium]|nr:GTPase ObgE [Dehalococcoidia bacterium]